MHKNPTFSQEQKDWICYKIGEWYSYWRDILIDYENKTHKLGFAKEILKYSICEDKEHK